jgi:NAD(P)H-flavin reductase
LATIGYRLLAGGDRLAASGSWQTTCPGVGGENATITKQRVDGTPPASHGNAAPGRRVPVMRDPSMPCTVPAVVTLPARGFTRLTSRAGLLRLWADAADLAFHAGQAVWLGRHGLCDRRPYSIASAPGDLLRDHVLDFLVGLEENDEPGPHLAGLEAGTLVDVEGPLGGFDLPPGDPRSPVLLVAGGTGVAPLRSMWRQLAVHAKDRPPIAVVYSARRADDMAFVPELRQLADRGAIGLTLTVTGQDPEWNGARGRVTTAMLAAHVPSPAAARCAVCGPTAFVTHVVLALESMGVSSERIATEKWG